MLDNRKTFKHQIVPLKQIDFKMEEAGRMYETPEGDIYPSVSTILSMTDHTALNDWKKRVGVEEAERVTRIASVSGEAVHSLCERYVSNLAIDKSKEMSYNWQRFLQIKKLLDEHVDDIISIEAPLYSNFLKVGGRVDLIAHWNGKPAIIDFKTSLKQKKESWVDNYKMQTAGYSVSFEELTGIAINSCVILMACDIGQAQIFYSKRSEWIKKFMYYRELYERKYKI